MYNFGFFTMVKTKTELLTVKHLRSVAHTVASLGWGWWQFTFLCIKLSKNPHLNEVNVKSSLL